MRSRAGLAVIVLCAGVFSCKCNDPVEPANGGETWRLTVAQTLIAADLTLSRDGDNAIVASGWWTAPTDTSTVTCHFSACPVTISGATVTFVLEGVATYSLKGSAYRDTSDFVLNMSGAFESGVSNGTWTLMFAKSFWAGASGAFTGTRTRGDGITP